MLLIKNARRMMSSNKHVPLLLERLQAVNEACEKKEEIIKIQGEYMQENENRILELENEIRDKDDLIFELNTAVQDQRDRLEGKYGTDNSRITSFDSKLNDSRTSRIKKVNQAEASFHNDDDIDHIEELREDVQKALKQYEILEFQKDDLEDNYKKELQSNKELRSEIANMEEVITDQDNQIKKMREKLLMNNREQKRNEIIDKNKALMQYRLGSKYNETQSELDLSANISKQIIRENYKDGKIGKRDTRTEEVNINEDVIKDVLNQSYQIISSGRKDRSLSPLALRSRKAQNSGGSTTAEGDSHYKAPRSRRFGSIGNNLSHELFFQI